MTFAEESKEASEERLNDELPTPEKFKRELEKVIEREVKDHIAAAERNIRNGRPEVYINTNKGSREVMARVAQHFQELGWGIMCRHDRLKFLPDGTPSRWNRTKQWISLYGGPLLLFVVIVTMLIGLGFALAGESKQKLAEKCQEHP